MTNPTGYPVIDGILESIAPRTETDRELSIRFPKPYPGLTTRNSAEANAELDEQFERVCRQAIRRSPLWAELTNDQWDALAERLRGQVRQYVDEQIDAELTRVEAERGFGY